MPNQKCVIEGCRKTKIEARGLCVKHYHEAYYEVEVKKSTTWRKLETHKPPLATPKGTRRTKSKIRSAIAGMKS